MDSVSDVERELRAATGLPEIALDSASARRRLLAIRSAALAEFRIHGYRGATVDEIARRSGVSKPTIYTYYGTKERLFLDAIGQALLAAYDGLPAVGAWSDAWSARAALSSFLLEWARRMLAADTIALRRIVIGEVERFPQLGSLWALSNSAYGDRPLAEAVTAMAAAGLLELPADDLPLRQLIAMSLGVPQLAATFQPEDFDARELPEIADRAVSVFWSFYGRTTR